MHLSLAVWKTNKNHGIQELLGEDAVPGDGAADVELILGVLLGELSDLLRGQALVDIGAEGLGRLLGGEEEGVLGEFSHCRWMGGWCRLHWCGGRPRGE